MQGHWISHSREEAVVALPASLAQLLRLMSWEALAMMPCQQGLRESFAASDVAALLSSTGLQSPCMAILSPAFWRFVLLLDLGDRSSFANLPTHQFVLPSLSRPLCHPLKGNPGFGREKPGLFFPPRRSLLPAAPRGGQKKIAAIQRKPSNWDFMGIAAGYTEPQDYACRHLSSLGGVWLGSATGLTDRGWNADILASFQAPLTINQVVHTIDHQLYQLNLPRIGIQARLVRDRGLSWSSSERPLALVSWPSPDVPFVRVVLSHAGITKL